MVVTRLIQKTSSCVEVVLLILLTLLGFYDVDAMMIGICSAYLQACKFVGLCLAENEKRKSLIKCSLLCGWTAGRDF